MDSSSKKKRKRSACSGIPLLSDAVKSGVSIPADEVSEEADLFTGKELWLVQLPKEVCTLFNTEILSQSRKLRYERCLLFVTE